MNTICGVLSQHIRVLCKQTTRERNLVIVVDSIAGTQNSLVTFQYFGRRISGLGNNTLPPHPVSIFRCVFLEADKKSRIMKQNLAEPGIGDYLKVFW